jgi:DNA-binding NtrC family response regulator
MVRELRESRGTMVPSRDKKKEMRPSLKEIATRAVAEAERQAILLALLATRGNTTEAAQLLRVDDKTLHIKIKRYDIDTRLSDSRLESKITSENHAPSSGDHVRRPSLIN